MTKYVTLTLALIAVAGAAYWARVEGPLRDPEDALSDFYGAHQRAEDQLMDPLILAGSDVVPLVVEAVAEPDMPLRRYAIGYLGATQRSEAVTVLIEILHHDAVLYYFRSDALKALYRIKPSIATMHARRYVDRDDLLGQIATRIVSGSYLPGAPRSWWEAFRSVHH